MYFPVNCKNKCSLLVFHNQEFPFICCITGYRFWYNLFAIMRPLDEMEMEVSLIIIHTNYRLFIALQADVHD
jgi:hypothetical protein